MSTAVNNSKHMKNGSGGGGGGSPCDVIDCVFGVYLGATNMCVSVCRNGRTEVLANANGERVTPAVIRYLHGEQVIGTAALQSYHRHAEVTIRHTLSHVCADQHQVALSSLYSQSHGGFVLPASARSDSSSNRRNAEPTVVFSVEKVLTDLLRYLYDIAIKQVSDGGGSSPPLPAVLTVPTHWQSDHLRMLESAAKAAGFRVHQLISWPLAAALAYKLDTPPDHHQQEGGQPLKVCVVRVGGQSASAVCLAINSNGLLSLPHSQNHQFVDIGGTQLTSLLSHHVTERLGARLAPGERTRQRVGRAAETAKCVLSRLASVDCVCEGAGGDDGADLSCSLTRGRWEALLSQQQQQQTSGDGGNVSPLTVWCRMARDSVGSATTELSRILLCGGSARVPLLRRHLLAEFGPGVTLIDPGTASLEPDEVFAIGAAEQCAHLQTVGVSSPDRLEMALLSRQICVRTRSYLITDQNNSNNHSSDDCGDEQWRVLVGYGAPLPVVACYPVVPPAAEQPQEGERLMYVEVGLAAPQSSVPLAVDGVECVAKAVLRVVCGERVVVGVLISADQGLTVKVATSSKPTGRQVVVLAPSVCVC